MVSGKEGNCNSKQLENQKGNKTGLGVNHAYTLRPKDRKSC